MNTVVDINITPIGTEKSSISSYIAVAEKVLRRYPELEVHLYPMSTTISGDLDTILRAVREMHEAPFQQGARRVSTSIRIDDRRDGVFESLEDRVKAVQEKIGAV